MTLHQCNIFEEFYRGLFMVSHQSDISKKVGSVLVTGGAGYIGSNIVLKLLQKGYDVVVIDNFSNSYHSIITSLKKKFKDKLHIYNFDLLDKNKLKVVLNDEHIRSVIHMAGKKYVPESFEKIEEYRQNNVVLTKCLLDVMNDCGVKNLIFSSSITVYGNQQKDTVDESSRCNPLSPYAKQKRECELMISDWQKRNQACAVVLRLSNPVGANTTFNLGDKSKMKKYMGVLPYIVENAQKDVKLVFNGGDHQTKDGTTVRDYIHVEDVANAFINALENLQKSFNIYNIGSGMPGYSVLDLLVETEKCLAKKIKYTFGPKRPGDISTFVSDNSLAKSNINFTVSKDLSDMVKSQFEFSKND